MSSIIVVVIINSHMSVLLIFSARRICVVIPRLDSPKATPGTIDALVSSSREKIMPLSMAIGKMLSNAI